ncbi:hypothetical protein [Rhodoblastus sp.]|uniref:hypothetical protein n=1 Tax=Rhodoblastus sp. TaxID=1962975 RepID=UPI003F9EB2F5
MDSIFVIFLAERHVLPFDIGPWRDHHVGRPQQPLRTFPPAPGAVMPRQFGVATALFEPHPSHLKRLSFTMFGKSVSSGSATTSKDTGSDRLQSLQST